MIFLVLFIVYISSAYRDGCYRTCSNNKVECHDKCRGANIGKCATKCLYNLRSCNANCQNIRRNDDGF